MKTIYKFNILVSLALFFSNATAQEIILPLNGNSELYMQEERVSTKKGESASLLELPFQDDFFYQTSYPDPQKWGDNVAFINHTYAVNPPTIGVATLDALNHQGAVYAHATLSPKTFVADTLTSLALNLDYSASDSIYLSFFYQAAGLGLAPGEYDSLCVDYYNVTSKKWITKWNVPGDSLDAFKQVLLPIKDSVFLHEGFKFRFRNLASLPSNNDYADKRGNVDHWNIDYVRLDKNRSYTDTIIRDVAFSKPLSSMMKDYEAIPWSCFSNAFVSNFLPYISITYFNNDTATRNITRKLEVVDEIWDETYDPGTSTSQDILPFTSTTYKLANIYPFNFERGDQGRFRIKSWLRTDEFDNHENDTIYRTQIFRDYYAYDDGTAERTYGLRGQGTANGSIAVKFNAFTPGTLAGVDIYFGQLMDSLNLAYYFKFMVWDDNGGIPGKVIYDSETDHTTFYNDELNKFTRVTFDNPVYTNTTFYVGLVQFNKYLLNIGLDVNNPDNGKIFYNLGTGWIQSLAPGSLMIRPFLKMGFFVDTEELAKNNSKIKYWPNPASNYLRIQASDDLSTQEISMTIYDLSGKIITAGPIINNEISLHNIAEGIYFIRFNTQNNILSTEKIIIRH